MLGSELVRQLTANDLDQEIIVTETQVIRIGRKPRESVMDCKDGVCEIKYEEDK